MHFPPYFSVRKEDPAALKTLIINTHAKARDGGDALEAEGGSRIKFVLETLANVKNNNLNGMKSNPGFVDHERDQNCQKRIRSVTGNVQLEPMSKIGISDVKAIAENGRWWQVGAAVVVKRNDKGEEIEMQKITDVSEKMVKTAKKLRFNTDNKRSIFYLFNTCEDFIDASNKIFGMRLKGSNRQVN